MTISLFSETPMIRRQKLSLANKELLSSPVLSEACGSSMQVLAIMCEWAFDAGFMDLVTLYKSSPDIIESWRDKANAALRGLKKLEKFNG